MADDWLRFHTDEPDLDAGIDVLLYLLSIKEWIHRRVEQVEIIDSARFRRRISVDIHIPDLAPSLNVAGNPLVLLPIARLDRSSVLRNVDLRGEDGRSLSVLTREENSQLTWSVLVAAARATIRNVSGSDLEEVPAWLVDQFRAVAFSRPTGEEAARSLHAEMAASSALEAKALRETRFFGELLENLANKFLFIVPVGFDPGRRRVIKLAYQDSIAFLSEDEEALQGSVRDVQRGWEPTPLVIPTPALDEAESYHYEMTAPPGCEIAAVVMRDENGGVLAQEPDPSALVHLHVPNAREGTKGTVEAFLRPTRGGIVRSSWWFSLGVLVTMIFLNFRLDQVRESSVGSLLLALPGLVGVLLVIHGENEMTTRLLFPLRVCVAVMGALPAIAAIGITAGFEGWWLRIAWNILLVIGLACFYVLSGIYQQKPMFRGSSLLAPDPQEGSDG